jgi:hypothetical protein
MYSCHNNFCPDVAFLNLLFIAVTCARYLLTDDTLLLKDKCKLILPVWCQKITSVNVQFDIQKTNITEVVSQNCEI